MKKIDEVRLAIMNDPENIEFTKQGWEPIFVAPPTAKILIASQAPGRRAQKANKTFYDVSGDLLREWLDVDEELFYHSGLFGIVPVDYYFPGKAKTGDLPPRKHMAEKWNPQIIKTMPQLEMTILVGAHAQDFYLGKSKKKNLTKTVRNYKEYLPEYFPIVHPSPLTIGWQRRNPWFEEIVLPDLKRRVHQILFDE